MEDIVPVTGRVLRYWYGALAAQCRHQIYDFLGVDEPAATVAPEPTEHASWANAEIWSQPEPGHERTVLLQGTASGLVLRQKVRMSPDLLTHPASRRPGTIVRTTFGCSHSRLGRARTTPGTGFI